MQLEGMQVVIYTSVPAEQQHDVSKLCDVPVNENPDSERTTVVTADKDVTEIDVIRSPFRSHPAI